MILCYVLLCRTIFKALAHATSIMHFIRGQPFTLQASGSHCLWLLHTLGKCVSVPVNAVLDGFSFLFFIGLKDALAGSIAPKLRLQQSEGLVCERIHVGLGNIS